MDQTPGKSKTEPGTFSVEDLAALFIRDLSQGAGGSDVRAGVIKGATSLNVITEGEEMVLRAGAQAHLSTGAPISTHTQAGTMGLEQIAILKESGVDPTRVAIGHVDRNLDYDYHKAMLDTGAYLIYDHLSKDGFHVSMVQEPETSFAADVASRARLGGI